MIAFLLALASRSEFFGELRIIAFPVHQFGVANEVPAKMLRHLVIVILRPARIPATWKVEPVLLRTGD